MTHIGDSQWFVLPVNPEPWAIGPVGYGRRAGKMSAYVGRNQQLAAFQEAVREAIGPQELIDGDISITFFFWREQVDYKTPQARTARKHEADATNLQKSTEDALQGILYKNDKDNKHVESYIIEQGPDVVGKIVIRISECKHDGMMQIPAEMFPEILKIDMTAAMSPSPSSNVWNGPDA